MRVFGVIMLALCLMVATAVFAQEKPAEKKASDKDSDKWESSAVQQERAKYKEDQRPEENYLAKFKAQEIVEFLIKENLEKIYMLKVVVSNFPQDSWNKDYNTIYEGYKKAMTLYYKRDVIYSRVELEKNKKAINELYKKMSDKYREDTEKMMDVCAETILVISLNAKTKSDPNKMKQFYKNLMRVRIAYSQMDDAMSAYRDLQFQTSLFHFRVAKAYAIQLMEELLDKESLEKHKDLYSQEEYSSFSKLAGEKDKFNLPIHKADNLNRILDEKQQASKPASTTK